MTLEQLLIEARALVAEFDALHLSVNSLTLHDLGIDALGGYVATFDFEETLQSESDYEYWYEHADDFPRTAKAATARDAVQKAIAKTRAELADYKRKNFRYRVAA